MVSEICLLGPQFTEVVQSYEKELESRGYRASSIEYLLFSIKRIFNSSIDGQRSYSISKSQKWLEMQQNRLLAKEIKPKYFSDMNTAVEQFNQYWIEGELIIKRRASNPMRPLPEPLYSIQQEFMRSLPISLKPTTLCIYEENSRQFLLYLQENSILGLKPITFPVVEKYLAQAAVRHSRSMDKVLRTVKLLLPILGEELDISILRPGYARRSVLPHFSYEEVRGILNTIDRSVPIGKRDLAIISVAIYTGLRLGDVLNMRLNDIDWRQQELRIIQQKTGTQIRMPLHIEAGNAVADYILNGRPQSKDDHIFIKHHAPYSGLTGHGVGAQIFKRCFLADDTLAEKCAAKTFHAFRRSLGSWLSKEQVPLPLISEILGHTNQEASKYYLSYNHIEMEKCCLGLDHIPVYKEDLL